MAKIPEFPTFENSALSCVASCSARCGGATEKAETSGRRTAEGERHAAFGRCLFSAIVLLTMLFLLSFSAAAADVYCCAGESINVEKKSYETVWVDEEYLLLEEDGSFFALKKGTTEIVFSHTEAVELPSKEEETTEPEIEGEKLFEDEVGDGDADETTESETREVVVERRVTVVISAEVKKIKLNKTKLTLGKGESFSLSYSLTSGTHCNNVRFYSLDNKIASVDKAGKVTAKRIGTTTVVAETSNGRTAECTVTVKKAPKTLSLNVKSLELGVGETFNLKASCDKDGASFTKTFTSSNPKILKVETGGKLIALKKGKVTVTVKTFNSKTASCVVNVKAAPKSIAFSASSLTLGKGESYKLKVSLPKNSACQTLSFSVSDKKLGTVNRNGVLKTLAVGKLRVTVTAYNGVKATCVVRIKKAPTKISADETYYTLRQGKRFSPAFSFGKNEYSNAITYSSSDNAVVSVLNGKVWAKKIGSAWVTATTFNGKSCSFCVTVKAMNVPFVSQLPSYPTGCEAASCTALLRYYGYDITLEQMINTIPREDVVTVNGTRYGPSIYEKFAGDPRRYYNSASPGYGAFSPCVTKALQKAINARGGKHKATLLTGCELDDVLKEVSLGRPAIVWSTYRMLVPQTVNSWYVRGADGRYRYFEYPRGTHVTVLTGYSDGYVTLMDPIDGTVSYNIYTFENRWNLLGNQAVVLK